MRSTLGLLLGLFLASSVFAQTPGQKLDLPYTLPSPPPTFSDSYILIDVASGQMLIEQRADKSFEPASLTKLMTAYIAFQAIKDRKVRLSDEIKISEKAWSKQGSQMFLRAGQQVSISELLRGMIIQSGNDAATALAEALAGSEKAFVVQMNQTAKQLGMNHTHFMNASGLPHPEHLTTAKDLATLSLALIKEFPDFYPWFSQKSFEFNAINQNNRNRLLWQDTSVDGLKTGFTKNSGYSIAASALRDDTRLIAVVMGTNSPETRTESTQRLLNYGFRFFETRQLFSAKNPIENIELIDGDIKEVPVGLSEDFLLSFPKGQYARLITQFDINHPVIAPIRQGQILGKLVIKLGKKTLAERPLVALVDVKENHLIGRVWHTITDSIDSFGSQ